MSHFKSEFLFMTIYVNPFFLKTLPSSKAPPQIPLKALLLKILPLQCFSRHRTLILVNFKDGNLLKKHRLPPKERICLRLIFVPLWLRLSSLSSFPNVYIDLMRNLQALKVSAVGLFLHNLKYLRSVCSRGY